MKSISVFAPATIGNFIVGFDVLGACLQTDDRVLGDVLTLSQTLPASYSATGEFAHRLPDNKDNLVIKTAEFFNQQLKQKPEKIDFVLSKNLPIGSGLGSSSSSIVATLYGLNEWYNRPFSYEQLLLWSAQIEGNNSGSVHYDNVAPCLLGGLQLINHDLSKSSHTLPFFDDLHIALCFPDIEITTKAARDILPATVTLQQSITMQSRLASFVAACYSGNKHDAIALMKDEVFTPKRQQLIPNYTEAEKIAIDNGALTFCLSGSGPTCFALCDDATTAKTVSVEMLRVMQQGEHAFACVAQMDNVGARLV